MTTIIDGRKLQKEILAKVKSAVALLSFQPVFCDVLVGDDKVSAQYVAMKDKTAESIGIKFVNAVFNADIKTEDLVKEIEKLNKLENMCGIIVQLPLPKTIDTKKVLNAIDPSLDVDCLGSITSVQFYNQKTNLSSPAALACMVLLDSLKLNLENKKIVVLGQGDLVGRPVSALLRFRYLNYEVISSESLNKEEIIKNADVIISGIGKGKYIKGDMIKKGVVLIDAGTSESTNSIVGDVDFESVQGVASFVSPVPGGVGPVTIAMLFNNVLEVAKVIKNSKNSPHP